MKLRFFVFFGLLAWHSNAMVIKRQAEDGEFEYEINVADKTYSFSYETPDGSFRDEEGYFETDPETGKESAVVSGIYSFVAVDHTGLKRTYTVDYIADKNGYRIIPLRSGSGGGTIAITTTRRPTTTKGIDSKLVCSLIGSSCK